MAKIVTDSVCKLDYITVQSHAQKVLTIIRMQKVYVDMFL